MEGGIQVNGEGRRFCDESRGYSEQAAEVLRQVNKFAWTIFGDRSAAIARQFEDFRNAERAGAIVRADNIEALARAMKMPTDALVDEWSAVERLKARGGRDRFGRMFVPAQRCEPPFCAVKVTGALFHTQGGLGISAEGRVKRSDGALFSNLFAAGGAAVGLSGPRAAGYLSGNGLLTATVLGRLAGRAAARQVAG